MGNDDKSTAPRLLEVVILFGVAVIVQLQCHLLVAPVQHTQSVINGRPDGSHRRQQLIVVGGIRSTSSRGRRRGGSRVHANHPRLQVILHARLDELQILQRQHFVGRIFQSQIGAIQAQQHGVDIGSRRSATALQIAGNAAHDVEQLSIAL